MKYYKMLMLLTLVAAGLAAGCSDDEDPLKDWTGPSKPGTEIKTPAEVGNRVVAHRGGSTEAGTRQFPDNSVAALNYAIGLGCYASECDIYLTKDDDVVVAHASAGCYINNLKPWEHTLAELRAAGTLDNGEQLPSLADFIDVVLEAGTTRLWLDVKNITIDGKSTEEGREASARACERACEIIEEMGAQNFCEFIVTGNATKISSGSPVTIWQRSLAAAGASPIFGVYGAFLQRSYDELWHDLCLNCAPATILDIGASVFGASAETHLNYFDLAMLGSLPNLRVFAPTCVEEYLLMLDWSLGQRELPVVIRVPGTKPVSRPDLVADLTDAPDFSKPAYRVVKHGQDAAVLALGDFF